MPSSFAWNVAAIFPRSSLSIMISTIPFLSTPRTILTETFMSSSLTITGTAYCSSFARILFTESCAESIFISRTSRLVTWSLFIIVFITFSASSPSFSCATAISAGSETASPNSSNNSCLIASKSSASTWSSPLWSAVLLPKIFRNIWFRWFSIDSIASTFDTVFEISYLSRIR